MDDNEDYLFIELDDSDQEHIGDEDNVVAHEVNSANDKDMVHQQGYGQCKQFQGLADMPLPELATMLDNAQTRKVSSCHDSPLRYSPEQVMKLRSIMRFATEYHNALRVQAAAQSCDSGKTTLTEFVETADECFDLVCHILLSGEVSRLMQDSAMPPTLLTTFEKTRRRLASLEELAKHEIRNGRWKNQPRKSHQSVSEQAVSAVVGQMDDFLELMREKCGPNSV